jgi:YD repeat-containing protein
MKTKLFGLVLFALIFGFYSCEVEDGVEPEEKEEEVQTKEVYLLTKKTQNHPTAGISTTTYSYNDENQLTGYELTAYDGEMNNEYELSYDTEGRISSVTINGELKDEYEYSTGKVTHKSKYTPATGEGFWITYNIDLNADGKAQKEQEEGSDIYRTYEWLEDNMISETYFSEGNDPSKTEYTRDEEILNPAAIWYMGKHTVLESKNAATKKVYGAGSDYESATEYSLTANEAGYLTKSVIDGVLGTVTTSYTYKVVEVEVEK